MKSKIACKRIALLGCVLLALNIFAPVIVKAVPITLTLDNPNQTLASPPSAVTLDFTGTVTIAPDFHVNFAKIDFMCMGNTGICLPLPAFDPRV
jgi:hypothetical protein